jgi:hypothetical protein
LHFEHVIRALQWVRLAAEVEGKVRQVGNLATFNQILSIPGFLSTDLGVKHLGDINREDDE